MPGKIPIFLGMQKRYYLLGYMGVGKSTLAKRWAKASGLPWHDLDQRLEAEIQMPISEYIKTRGELAFRKLERAALANTQSLTGILSVGGGTPCFYDNMQVMEGLGTTIYLHAGVGFLTKRLQDSALAGNERPLLAGVPLDGYAEFIGKHLLERMAFYERAEVRISVEKEDALEVLLALSAAVKRG